MKKYTNKSYHYSKYTQSIWPKDYHEVKDIYPLKQVPFGEGIIITVNKPRSYLDRMYKGWPNIGYITLDADHFLLDKQIVLDKNDMILTGKGSLF